VDDLDLKMRLELLYGLEEAQGNVLVIKEIVDGVEHELLDRLQLRPLSRSRDNLGMI
jgi:hypothetical protein